MSTNDCSVTKGPGRVLIVDDDSALLEIMGDVLRREGYLVDERTEGLEGLACLQRETPPRLVLLDLVLQDIDAFDFRGRQLAEPALAVIPVVVLSGASDIAAICATLRVDDYLQKPFEVDQFLAVVAKHWS